MSPPYTIHHDYAIAKEISGEVMPQRLKMECLKAGSKDSFGYVGIQCLNRINAKHKIYHGAGNDVSGLLRNCPVRTLLCLEKVSQVRGECFFEHVS